MIDMNRLKNIAAVALLVAGVGLAATLMALMVIGIG